MLPPADRRDPGLGDHDAIDTGASRPRFHIDVVEVVEQSDDVAGLHAGATFDQRLIVPLERRDGEARAVDHLGFHLRPRRVMQMRLDRPAQLPLMNRGGEDAKWVENETALFMPNVQSDGDGGYEVTATDGTTFSIDSFRLHIVHKDGTEENQDAYP